MKRIVATLVMIAFLSVTLAGCLGGGGFGSGAPRAVVTVEQTGEYDYVFDASGSSGSGLSYSWDFGDGTTATDARVEHHFEYGDAPYTVRLVIEDSNGVPDVWEEEIIVGSGENPPPVALFSLERRNFAVDSPVRVDASASYDPDGAPLRFHWDFNHLMGDYDEYEDFRAAKKEALERLDGDDGDFDVGGGSGDSEDSGSEQSTSASGFLKELINQFDPTGLFGDKHVGHDDDGSSIQPSLFSHTAQTEDPVYVLDQGFPDATVFFIRLQVFDIKGGHEEILSEEIWPVEVWNQGRVPATTASGSESGSFQLGLPSQITDLHDEGVPDPGLFETEDQVEFKLDWPPVAARQEGTNFYPGGFINLTWEAESDEFASGDFGSILDMNVTAPSGATLGSRETSWGLMVELDGRNDYFEGNFEKPFVVTLNARSGINIDWQLDYWAKLDTNPFASREDAYV